MEETIEANLIRDVYNKMDHGLAKLELLSAYKRRKINIAEMKQAHEPFDLLKPKPKKPLYEY